jgi:acetoacetyl-CoA synthetase
MESVRKPIWSPKEADLKSSMAKFRDFCNGKYGIALSEYHDLHAWSVNPKTASNFWMALFEFLDVGATIQPTRALMEVGHSY